MAATAIANDYLRASLLDGTFGWTSGAAKAELFTKNTWTPSRMPETYASIFSSGGSLVSATGYAAQSVTGRTVALDPTHVVYGDLDTIIFNITESGATFDTLVIYKDVANVFFRFVFVVFTFETFTTNGEPVVFQFDANGAVSVS